MLRYVIVGNGVAGTTAAQQIRQADREGEITVFTDEPTPFYTRIRLPEYIAGEVEEEKLVLHKTEWYEERAIQIHLEEPVLEIDEDRKAIRTARGKTYGYDRLLLAVGSHAFIPPIAGAQKAGVFTLRSLADARRIRQYAQQAKKAVLIGGGVLGLEAGNGLRKLGVAVTVVEFFPRLLPRQTDVAGAELLKRQMEAMGFRFYLDARSKEIQGATRAERLILEDGEAIPCDMVLVSAGVRPNLDLPQKLGLEVEKGVLVDDRLETGHPDIYAAGDLIQHRGVFYGIWPASEQQGSIAGSNMAGGDKRYQGTVVSNRLKVAGIDLVASGDIDAEGKLEALVKKDEENFVYRKFVLKDDTIIGCVLLGDISGHREILEAIEEKKNLGLLKGELLDEEFDFKRLTA